MDNHHLSITHVYDRQGRTVRHGMLCMDDSGSSMSLLFHLSLRADTTLRGCMLRGHVLAPIPPGIQLKALLETAKGYYAERLRRQGGNPRVEGPLPSFDGVNLEETRSVAITADEAERLARLLRLGLIAGGVIQPGR